MEVTYRVIVLIALATFAPVPGALAGQVAVVTAEGISVAETPAGPAQMVAPGAWVDVAYTTDGRLLATRALGDDGCELVDPTDNALLATSSRVLPQIDRSQGLCEIASAPTGGVLFEADNLTAGSSSTFHLDLAQGTASLLLYGYSASQAATGATVTIQHRYFRNGGSYEQPWLLPGAGQRARPLTRAPKPRSSQAYHAVAISRDGRDVAAARSAGKRGARDELLVGSTSGALGKVRWRLPARQRLGQMEFLPDGTGLLVIVAASSSRVLYQTDLAGAARTRWVSGVQAFAVK